MAAQTDEAFIQALRSVALDTGELADLRRLYDAPAGVDDAPGSRNHDLVRRCSSVGRRLRKRMGPATRGANDLIGYCDPDTGTWRMKPEFRRLMRELGLVEQMGSKTLVEELDELDDFQQIEALASTVAQQVEAIRCSECLAESDREELLKARFGHGRFRAAVGAFEPGCRVTGVSEPGLLHAAHIKPWLACSNHERLDGANGLLLTPSYHLLFSKGYISFDAAGCLLVSATLPPRIVQGWSVAQHASPRAFARRQLEYIEYHAGRLFKP